MELGMSTRSIACIGFMGAGKSTAAQSLAGAIGAEAVDVDQVLVQRLGKPIAQVFAQDGEAAFRQAEEKVTLELLSADVPAVLALGGGAAESPRVQEALQDHLVVWVDIDPDTAWERCGWSDRPLAQDREQFERLYRQREPAYWRLANVVVPSQRSRALAAVASAIRDLPAETRLLWAVSASAEYPAYIGAGLLGPERFWPAELRGRRFVVTDENVGRLYGDAVGPNAGPLTIPPGEGSKTISQADAVWRELARAGATRADLVVALGGGVVGDLAGFCAATYQRGVRYVQVPTTLVAQVDSAYGGKTGVDLPEAKNYVGAYHQPSAVITDIQTLGTLPQAELASGYAEVVKTALIAGAWLWEQVSAGADPSSTEVVSACALTKLRIVGRDERDEGLRQVLNLGHTVGHAIESATGYRRYRHGEAVALGLLAALRLSGQEELLGQVRELLRERGLPSSLDGVDPDAVVALTARDKKRRGEHGVPFVLLDGPGRPRAGCAVSPRELELAVRELGGS
jgi:shikimate kinase/3-dehydroquinate synthase